ncbi:hypothetical protein [Azomonas macrocytogenes]|uniref:Uncharacterized protein n=1 Tax=Azomonas macrocytogenes TaxID=69962 RepID=A0A839T5S1_AZOMA|nr:hypothetical protein [Azomonas macrocytogenes]MBB3104399.1 hypothetical protein [Azomonas macrocytogenes]
MIAKYNLVLNSNLVKAVFEDDDEAQFLNMSQLVNQLLINEYERRQELDLPHTRSSQIPLGSQNE